MREAYLDDFEDVAAAVQALQDPADPVLDGTKCAVSLSVRTEASAAEQLARIDVRDRRILVDHIDRLAMDPNVGTKLKGELTGLRRIRVGKRRSGACSTTSSEQTIRTPETCLGAPRG